MTQVFAENGELIPVTVIEARSKRCSSKERQLKRWLQSNSNRFR